MTGDNVVVSENAPLGLGSFDLRASGDLALQATESARLSPSPGRSTRSPGPIHFKDAGSTSIPRARSISEAISIPPSSSRSTASFRASRRASPSAARLTVRSCVCRAYRRSIRPTFCRSSCSTRDERAVRIAAAGARGPRRHAGCGIPDEQPDGGARAIPRARSAGDRAVNGVAERRTCDDRRGNRARASSPASAGSSAPSSTTKRRSSTTSRAFFACARRFPTRGVARGRRSAASSAPASICCCSSVLRRTFRAWA